MPGEMDAPCAYSEYQMRRVVEPGAIAPGGEDMTHVGLGGEGSGDVADATSGMHKLAVLRTAIVARRSRLSIHEV